jgi:hypothetical protein
MGFKVGLPKEALKRRSSGAVALDFLEMRWNWAKPRMYLVFSKVSDLMSRWCSEAAHSTAFS